MGSKVNKWVFVMLLKETYTHLEDPYHSMKQYFPNDQHMMAQNHRGVTYPFRLQDRATNFIESIKSLNHIKYEEFTNITSDSTQPLTLKKPPLRKIWYRIKE